MPDKLTDSEIVKALECCVGDNDGKNCFDCPLWEIDDCQEQLLLDALDVINRLQAENERLRAVKKHIDILIHRGIEYPTAESYNEAFQKALARLCDNTKAKAEAYKECIEMLKKKGINIGVGEIFITTNTLNNLLKELVGDSNG